MLNRIKLTLEQPEYSALLELATRELRGPDEQAHHIVRQELERRGLLSTDDSVSENEQGTDVAGGSNHAC